MKIKFQKGVLRDTLSRMASVIPNKTTVPIIEYCMIEFTKEKAVFTATDLEITIRETIDFETKEEGFMVIDPKFILDLIAKLPDEEIQFTLNKKSIKIIAFTGEYDIPAYFGEGKEFPETKIDSPKNKMSGSFDVFRRILAKCLFATADDDLRPVMNGVCMRKSEESKECIDFVSSDAHKLVKLQHCFETEQENIDIILPKKFVGIFSKIKKDGEVDLSYNDKNIVVSYSSDNSLIEMSGRLVEGNYPAYNSVIPEGYESYIIADVKAFLNAIDRLNLTGKKGNVKQLSIDLKEDKAVLSLSDVNANRKAKEEISCTVKGELEIDFNINFIAEILKEMKADQFRMSFSEPSRPVLFHNYDEEKEQIHENVLMLLMPLMRGS